MYGIEILTCYWSSFGIRMPRSYLPTVRCCNNTPGAWLRCYPEVTYPVDNYPTSHPELGSGFLRNLIPCSPGIARCTFSFAFTFCMFQLSSFSSSLLIPADPCSVTLNSHVQYEGDSIRDPFCIFQGRSHILSPSYCIYSSPGSFSCNIVSKPSTISFRPSVNSTSQYARVFTLQLFALFRCLLLPYFNIWGYFECFE